MWTTPAPATLLCAAALLAACGGGSSSERPADRPGVHHAPETAAVARVDMDEREDPGGGRIEDVLAGRAAGLQVLRQPDGTVSLRIRGATSVYGNNEPLLVIDGTIISPTGSGSALASLSPREVETVEVLKDASASFYGSRGANGVVLITTRH